MLGERRAFLRGYGPTGLALDYDLERAHIRGHPTGPRMNEKTTMRVLLQGGSFLSWRAVDEKPSPLVLGREIVGLAAYDFRRTTYCT